MPADAPPVELSATAPPVAAPRQEVPDFSANGEFPQTVLGVYDDTYILAAGPHGLVLIDQHAAHERVMFERLLDQAAHGAPSQPLLLPETLELPRNNCSLLLKYRKIFEQLGFDFEPMGSCTIMLNALPAAIISKRPLTELIPDMLGEILDNSENHIPVEPAYVARAACRAAVKAHETLPLELARQLLRELAACRQGTLCPHGRPTLITIKLSEIEKRFGRR